MPLAAVGPLTLAADNPGEYWIGDIGILLIAAAGVAILCCVLRKTFAGTLDDNQGAAVDAILVGVLTVPFLVARELPHLLPGGTAFGGRETLVSTVAVVAVATASLRWTVGARAIRAFLFGAAAVSIILSSIRIVTAEAQLRTALASSPTARALRSWDASAALHGGRIASRPDVFLLVLDAYAGDRLLQEAYAVDHRLMREELENLGFMPPAEYSSNYSRTFASLSSILNFSHVDQVEQEPIGRTQHTGFLNALTTDSRAARLFQAAGYDLHWIPAPLFGGRRLSPAKARVHREWPVTLRLFGESDLIATWLQEVFTPGAVLTALGVRPDYTATVDAALRVLPQLASDGRPSFVIVHLFATHEPLSYAPTCRADPNAVARYGLRRAYASAVACLDAELVKVFRDMVGRTGGEVVIAAVGDHAPSLLQFDESSTPPASIPRDVLATRFDAGAFFYVPMRMRSDFKTPRSGVNVVPALVSAAFRVELPRQPDSLYYSRPRPFPIHDFFHLQTGAVSQPVVGPGVEER